MAEPAVPMARVASAIVPPSVVRAAAPAAVSLPQLGPLQELPGTWFGNGFNLISVPDKQDNKPFRLMLNATREVLTFAQIGAPIPNRGSAQNDIFFLGLHYLQQVWDAMSSNALHIEPGLWLNVPQTSAPPEQPTVVRLATIPHGDSVLAQGTAFNAIQPIISPVSTTPFNTQTGKPETDPRYLQPFTTTPLPPGIPPGSTANPNLVLTTAIANQKIVKTVVLDITTTPNGGVVNIPFVVKNANVSKMSAIFWIETVQPAVGSPFLQLQYTQTVILDFLGISWPHVSVATLVKS